MIETLTAPRAAKAEPSRTARGAALPEGYEWMLRCTARLASLRPGESHELLGKVVHELWLETPHFSPELAAEIEHETWRWEH